VNCGLTLICRDIARVISYNSQYWNADYRPEYKMQTADCVQNRLRMKTVSQLIRDNKPSKSFPSVTEYNNTFCYRIRVANLNLWPWSLLYCAAAWPVWFSFLFCSQSKTRKRTRPRRIISSRSLARFTNEKKKKKKITNHGKKKKE